MMSCFRVFLVASVLLVAATLARADNLVPCPDCRKSVSPRAMFCPSCGCPGEVIAASVAAGKQVKRAEPDRLLRVVADNRAGIALPVQMADGLYALAPLDILLAAESLSLTFYSTNTPVVYAMPQVASNLPLVRFPITETNLTFWCLAPSGTRPKATLDYTTAFGPGYGVETTVRTIASLSEATNLIALIDSSVGMRGTYAVAEAADWVPIRPKAFREQGRLFGKLARGDAAPLPEKWCHPIFETLLKCVPVKEKCNE